MTPREYQEVTRAAVDVAIDGLPVEELDRLVDSSALEIMYWSGRDVEKAQQARRNHAALINGRSRAMDSPKDGE